MESFTDRLERLLKTKKISQKDLADSVGLRRQTISDWKKNGGYPTADIAVKIAQALNTSVEYLVTGKEPEQTDLKLQAFKAELQKLIDSN